MEVDASKVFNDENVFSKAFKKKLYRKRIDIADVIEMFNYELSYVQKDDFREKLLKFLNNKIKT